MNERYLYLAINFFSIIIPFLASFYRKAPYYKKWKYLFPAIAIPAIGFILWDELFTQMGIWGFNTRYLTGIMIGSLPIEEILFFVCIPYSSVFIYFSLDHFLKKDPLYLYQDYISSILAAIMLLLGALFIEKAYTSMTFILTGCFVAIHLLKWRSRYLAKFYLSYTIVLLPFFIVNGLLTGSFIDEEVVWYNDNENLGIRMGTIPVEDVMYGMLLLMMNVTIYERLQTRRGFFRQ